MAIEPKNRRFISCEGPDGCGKSTLARSLNNWLLTSCYKVKYYREPGGTALGEQLRTLILSSDYTIDATAELFLFCAARNTLVTQAIQPALSHGDYVILDRFADSTRVYQGYAGQLDRPTVEAILSLATGGLEPAVTFLPLADVETLWQRSCRVEERDRIENKGLDYLERVLNGYKLLAQEFSDRVVVLPANTEEETFELAIAELKKRKIL